MPAETLDHLTKAGVCAGLALVALFLNIKSASSVLNFVTYLVLLASFISAAVFVVLVVLA